jgi:hypothetical protein
VIRSSNAGEKKTMPQVFHLISEQRSPQFLGMTAAERNARIARRANVFVDAGQSWELPTLTVPAGVVITQLLIKALPPPDGLCHLRWNAAKPPLDGRGQTMAASTIQLPEDAALDVSTAVARRRAAWRLAFSSLL